MKLVGLFLLVAVAVVMGQVSEGFRTGQFGGGRSFVTNPKSLNPNGPDWRILDGKPVEVSQDKRFVRIEFKYWGVNGGGVIGERWDVSPSGRMAKVKGIPTNFVLASEQVYECKAVFVRIEDDPPNRFEVFDYCIPAPKHLVDAELSRRNEVLQRSRAEYLKAESERRSADAPKVLAYQHQQASNGLPSFQLILGKRYLTGDGVETNLALARHWLQSAATNGEPIATNLLSQLK